MIKVSDFGVLRVGPSYFLFNLRLLGEVCLSVSWRSTTNNPVEITSVVRLRDF